MRRLVIAMFVVAMAALAAATADAVGTGSRPVHATVSPRAGRPSTHFRVRFTSPVRTGTIPGMRSSESVTATGPTGTSACGGTAVRRVPPVAANARVSVRLMATGLPWCAGSYTGTITLYRTVRCQPGPVAPHRVCPLIEFAPERIGRFRFTVGVAQVQRPARGH